MGNCLALCRLENKSLQAPRAVTDERVPLRIAKSQLGKVLEHTGPPMIAEDIIRADFHGSCSKDMEGASCAKRIKLIITKQQLQELESKKMSVEELLLKIHREAGNGANFSTRWTPVLETIPE